MNMSNYEFPKNHTLLTYIRTLHKYHKIMDPLTYSPYSCDIAKVTCTHLPQFCNLKGYYEFSYRRQKDTTVVTHLFSDVMLKFSFPRILHYDDGREFKSKLIELLSAAWYKKDISPLTIPKLMEN